MSDSTSKKFSNMFRDNKEVIRLVIECVVLVGVFYYFNNKISNLSKHIEEISQKLELQDDLIEKQNLTITELSLNLNSKVKSTQPQQQTQQPFFFEQKEEPKKVKKVTPEPKPILKSTTSTPPTPKPQPKQVPVPEAPPPPIETHRVKFATPRAESTPEIDIFQFLHRQQTRPVQSTQEIEILEEQESEAEEIQEVKPVETEEERLDRELENEMKDLD